MLFLIYQHDKRIASKKKVKLSRHEKNELRKTVRANRKRHDLYLTVPGCFVTLVRSLWHRAPTLHLYH